LRCRDLRSGTLSDQVRPAVATAVRRRDRGRSLTVEPALRCGAGPLRVCLHGVCPAVPRRQAAGLQRAFAEDRLPDRSVPGHFLRHRDEFFSRDILSCSAAAFLRRRNVSVRMAWWTTLSDSGLSRPLHAGTAAGTIAEKCRLLRKPWVAAKIPGASHAAPSGGVLAAENSRVNP